MAIDHKFSSTAAKSVLELLQSNSRFIVPRFQRNYSWTTEKTGSLWNDIMENFDGIREKGMVGPEHQYLLGPIVLVNRKELGNTFDVIDGQQRLATLTMLFCVSRDIIREDIAQAGASKPEGFGKISEMIENTHMDERQSWKLELNKTDREFFREIQEFEEDQPSTQIRRIKKLKRKTKSLKLLRDNYVFLHKLITEALETNFGKEKPPNADSLDEKELRDIRINNQKTLLYFLTHVRENNYLIQIMVSDDEAAFQIFETLNERGQTLSRSNLIKNHILNRIKGNEAMQNEQSDKWDRIFDQIIKDEQSDDDFIMESYHSRVGDGESMRTIARDRIPKKLTMSRKNLYKIIQKMVDNEKECKKFVKELEMDAEFLSTLNNPSVYFDNETNDDIRALKALKAKFIRAPILAAYRKWAANDNGSVGDYRDLVRLLVKMFFKIRVVGQQHASSIEKLTQRVTEAINEGRPMSDIRGMILEEDDHESFLHDFEKKFAPEVESTDAAKYVLQQITIHMGSRYSDVRPIDELTLEHVLPKSSKAWEDNVEEFFEGFEREGRGLDDFKNRLGNLTLLKKSINSKLRNKKFIDKKIEVDRKGNLIGYEGSDLEINRKTVCNHDKWTAKIIVERERQFAELAGEIWRL